MPTTNRISASLVFSAFVLAGCSGGGGGGSASTNNDQNDPGNDDTSTNPNAKVLCLKQNLANLPEDKKKIIELSARAVIKCKANRSDMDTYLKSRRQ